MVEESRMVEKGLQDGPCWSMDQRIAPVLGDPGRQCANSWGSIPWCIEVQDSLHEPCIAIRCCIAKGRASSW